MLGGGGGAGRAGLYKRVRRAYPAAMARFLVIAGVALVLLGLLWGPLTRLGLGRLPGDIVIERESTTIFIPVTSAILVSVVLSVGVGVVRALLGR